VGDITLNWKGIPTRLLKKSLIMLSNKSEISWISRGTRSQARQITKYFCMQFQSFQKSRKRCGADHGGNPEHDPMQTAIMLVTTAMVIAGRVNDPDVREALREQLLDFADELRELRRVDETASHTCNGHAVLSGSR
jgi:hypothetical protein